MTKHNVNGENRRDLTKYRLTLAAALVGLVLAGWMIQAAYAQHVSVLRIGDATGEALQFRGLTTHQEAAEHEQR